MLRVGRHGFGLQRPQELVEQERVALRRGVAGLGERRLDPVAEPLASNRRHRVEAELPRGQDVSARVARELREQRLAVSGLGGTRAAHHEHRDAFEPVQDVGEVAERRAIAPVQIVDREKQRRFRAEVHGQPVEAVQGGEAPVTGGIVLRRLSGSPKTAAPDAAAPVRTRARTASSTR